MASIAGCRDVNVVTGTSGILNGSNIYVEVTNSNLTDVIFYANDFPSQGHPTNGDPTKGIPILAGTTRAIPMTVYNFTATGAVTVVAYVQ